MKVQPLLVPFLPLWFLHLYLPSSHIPQWNIWTPAGAETLVSFTHINMDTLGHLVLSADHSLPSSVFHFPFLFIFIMQPPCYFTDNIDFKGSIGLRFFSPPRLFIWGEDKPQEILSTWAPQRTRPWYVKTALGAFPAPLSGCWFWFWKLTSWVHVSSPPWTGCENFFHKLLDLS